jgi:N-acetylneuraminate synthase
MNIAFLNAGVDIIERHFTLSKSDSGLDISTSSDISEFNRLYKFCCLSVWSERAYLEDKYPNQGEIQNLKDLGSGYYFAKNKEIGDIIDESDLVIRSPCRGIRAGNILSIEPLTLKGLKAKPLTNDHFNRTVEMNFNKSHEANQLRLSLPVRLHDFKEIDNRFKLKNYEWHLSYEEVKIARKVILKDLQYNLSGKSFSIHLPDYISSTKLIDPFSIDETTSSLTKEIVEEVLRLANDLQDLTGEKVPVVGSFSVNSFKFKGEYYNSLSEYFGRMSQSYKVEIIPQFLPKIAWYFGGSVELDVFCSIDDYEHYVDLPFGICLDTAHCIMAASFFEQNPKKWLDKLSNIASYYHLSDAAGVDGEGVAFGSGNLGENIVPILKSPKVKVIEQWEGHLDNFKGFFEAIQFLIGK